MQTQAAAALDYLAKVHHRTMRVVRCIPPDYVDWSPKEGVFTLGDLARHLAVTMRYTFTENIASRPSIYSTHGRELAANLADILAFMEARYAEAMAIFAGLSDEDWNQKCLTADGASIARWKLLRLAIEHEIHHRGQLYTYLSLLGVSTPPLFGLTSEELRKRATRS